MKALCAGVVMLGIVAADAAAQDARLSRLDRRLQSGVAALVDSARTLGIPSEPVIDKALEGAAKRAPAPRILVVVQSRFAELVAGHAALGGAASEAEIIAAADALHAGASAETIAALRSQRRGSLLTIPLAVLADLIARGVPADTASAAVLALARTPATDQQFAELRLDVERDIARGAPPAIAAHVRARSLPPAGARTVPTATAAEGVTDRATTTAAPKKP